MAEKVEKLREEIAQKKTAIETAELRQHDALQTLREQAVSLGLSADAAASLRDAKDAVREVAHRLHYHMRRASHLEGAIEAIREEHWVKQQQEAPPDQKDATGKSATRIREMDELRERLAAVRRAREREGTARDALESEKAALRSKLAEVQARVSALATARVKVEAKANELQDQKRLLVREVKTTRRAVAKVDAEIAATSDPGVPEEDHRTLALRRVGLNKKLSERPPGLNSEGSDDASTERETASLGAREKVDDILRGSGDYRDGSSSSTTALPTYTTAAPPQPSSTPASPASLGLPRSSSSSKDLASASAPFALICRRCGGTVEGPKFSTCTCSVPDLP